MLNNGCRRRWVPGRITGKSQILVSQSFLELNYLGKKYFYFKLVHRRSPFQHAVLIPRDRVPSFSDACDSKWAGGNTSRSYSAQRH